MQNFTECNRVQTSARACASARKHCHKYILSLLPHTARSVLQQLLTAAFITPSAQRYRTRAHSTSRCILDSEVALSFLPERVSHDLLLCSWRVSRCCTSPLCSALELCVLAHLHALQASDCPAAASCSLAEPIALLPLPLIASSSARQLRTSSSQSAGRQAAAARRRTLR